jgi:hypothetical protein
MQGSKIPWAFARSRPQKVIAGAYQGWTLRRLHYTFAAQELLVLAKRGIAILGLALFLASLARPFLPYAEYALFSDFIAKTLCINLEAGDLDCEGKCYLNRQLQQAAASSASEPLPFAPQPPPPRLPDWIASSAEHFLPQPAALVPAPPAAAQASLLCEGFKLAWLPPPRPQA